MSGRLAVRVATLLVLASLFVAGLPATATDRRFGSFETVVMDQLRELNISAEAVRRITLDPQEEAHGTEQRVVGMTAWVRLDSCPQGSSIIDMRRDGGIRGIYTRGMCMVPGVPQFGD